MGDLRGDVRRIGIRASVVRTCRGAEIIVPNAQLISDRVTNWTLSDRHAARRPARGRRATARDPKASSRCWRRWRRPTAPRVAAAGAAGVLPRASATARSTSSCGPGRTTSTSGLPDPQRAGRGRVRCGAQGRRHRDPRSRSATSPFAFHPERRHDRGSRHLAPSASSGSASAAPIFPPFRPTAARSWRSASATRRPRSAVADSATGCRGSSSAGSRCSSRPGRTSS